MPDSLADIIDSDDPSKIAGVVVDRLIDHYGPDVDVSSISVEHRTVILVEHTFGAISNGGFANVLGRELPGDPNLSLMLAAYEATECDPAIAAVHRVFDVFPNRVPPSDTRERVKLFVKANRAAEGRLQTDFYRSGEALQTALARYIQNNRDAFLNVERSTPRTAEPTPTNGSLDPAAIGLPMFPKWARVAFAARCARLVLPLYKEAWPEAPDEYTRGLMDAVRLAEFSAAQGASIGDMKKAGLNAGQAAGAPMIRQTGYLIDDHNAPDDPVAAHTACFVGNSVRHAVKTVDNKEAAKEAYGFAKAAARSAENEDLLAQMQDDFRRLRWVIRKTGWVDASPVPPEVFDVNYVPPRKPWWKRW